MQKICDNKTKKPKNRKQEKNNKKKETQVQKNCNTRHYENAHTIFVNE